MKRIFSYCSIGVLVLILTGCQFNDTSEVENCYIQIEQGQFEPVIENKKKNNRISQFALAKLPPYILKDYVSEISDSTIKLLAGSSIAHYHLENSKAIELLNKLEKRIAGSSENNDWIREETTLRKLSIYSKDNKDIDFQDSIYNDNEKLNYGKLSTLERYFYLNKMKYKAVQLRHFGKTEEALIIVDYCLFLMLKDNLNNVLINTYADLLHTKSKVLLLEHDNYNEETLKLQTEAQVLFDKINNTSKSQVIEIEKATSFIQTNDTISAMSIYENTYNNEVNNHPYPNYYNAINWGFLLKQQRKNKQALKVFHNALKSLEKIDCSKSKSVLYLYLSDTYLSLGEEMQAKNMLDRATDLEQCGIAEQQIIEYYACWSKLEFTLNDFERTQDSKFLDKALNTIKLERQLALKMFPEKYSQHHGNYYMVNLEKYFQTSFKHNNISSPYLDTLIHLTYDSKKREIQRNLEKIKNKSTAENALETETISLVREINDHKLSVTADNLVYEKLFHLLYKKNNRNEVDKNPLTPIEASYNYPLKKIQGYISESTQILELTKTRSSYWVSNITQDKFSINPIEIEIVDSLLNQTHNVIQNYESAIKPNNFKQALISALGISKKHLIVIPDGKLSNLAFDAILGDPYFVEYAISIPEYLNREKVDLKISRAQIASYSDDATFNEISTKTYTELHNGYRESQAVSSILSDAPLSAGKQFTHPKLESMMDSDILHIATHAFSDSTNRLAQYILIRNDQGHPEKLYYPDFLKMKATPKFVNLSACETGTGYHLYGEGTYSISRAFIEKGTQSVIKSLWKVDDGATKEFMQTFYTHWKSGMLLKNALHKTKQEFTNHSDYAAPYYWAGFVLEGNGEVYLSDE